MSKQGNKNCIRHVIKFDEQEELKMFEAKIKMMGGEWRIHRTVNSRDVEKSRIWLLKHLIDSPENGAFVDSAWRTAVLQKAHRYTNYFMLDVDTKDQDKINKLNDLLVPLDLEFVHVYESPNGYHYITPAFDTREICKLDYVTLLRDGYYYIKTVKGE